jgi:hypothetical protein
LLLQKFETSLTRVFREEQRGRIRDICLDRDRLACASVSDFIDLMVV